MFTRSNPFCPSLSVRLSGRAGTPSPAETDRPPAWPALWGGWAAACAATVRAAAALRSTRQTSTHQQTVDRGIAMNTMNTRAFLNVGLAACLWAAAGGTAEAALLARAGGTMVYDSALDITWVADANLFKTQAAANPNLVAEILAAVPVVHDTPNIHDTPPNSGQHTLSAAEFDAATGYMSWFGAQAWAANLTYGGFDDWRLPTTVIQPECNGPSCTSSEMGHLWYGDIDNGLGGVAGEFLIDSPPFQGVHNANYLLFSNIGVSGGHWSETEEQGRPDSPGFAWLFSMGIGYQTSDFKNSQAFAWAVRNGDVAAVPVPAAVWLFASALAGLGVFGRRKAASNPNAGINH